MRKSVNRGSYKFNTFDKTFCSVAEEPAVNKVMQNEYSLQFDPDKIDEWENPLSQKMLDFYFKQNKLIEDFFIIGADPNDLEELKSSSNQ